MARKPSKDITPSATPAERGPARSLASAVAIELAQASVHAPVPPEIQAILDADPAETAKAREALRAAIAAAPAAEPIPESQPAAPAAPQE